MTSQSTIHCTICFLFFLKKVLITQTRLNVLLGNIIKLLSIKTTLQQLKPIWQCYKEFFI